MLVAAGLPGSLREHRGRGTRRVPAVPPAEAVVFLQPQVGRPNKCVRLSFHDCWREGIPSMIVGGRVFLPHSLLGSLLEQ